MELMDVDVAGRTQAVDTSRLTALPNPVPVVLNMWLFAPPSANLQVFKYTKLEPESSFN